MKDIFCRIIDGEIPCAKVYEDDDVLAFLDISQLTKGHTLVVPKQHCDSILNCPPELLGKVATVAQRIANAQINAFGAKGANVITNAGEVSGQSVPHFHVHVVPRYSKDDSGFQMVTKENEVSGDELSKIASEISAVLK